MMRRSPSMATACIACMLLCIVLFATCTTSRVLRKPDPASVELLTAGPVERCSPIRIVFTTPMASMETNLPLTDSPFSFSPGISGTSVWTDEKILEFRPSKPLPVGKTFVGTVDLAAGKDSSAVPAAFDFPFTVVASPLEMALGGLRTDSQSGDTYSLEGSLRTGNLDPERDVEKILSARLNGRNVDIAWIHREGKHEFKIDGINRDAGEGQLELAWNGRFIENGISGRRVILVPEKNSFKVLSMEAKEEERNRIDIVFSDPLSLSQDLRGVVSVDGRDDVQAAVDGNRLRLYTLASFQTREQVTINGNLLNSRNERLERLVQQTVNVSDELPRVKIPGTGVIVPTSQGTTIPIETMNLRGVIVEAFRVYGDAMTQFLQVNTLPDTGEMYRVGKVVWRKVIPLPYTDENHNKWTRHGLDLSPLIKAYPDGMFQLRITFRPPHIVWPGAPDMGPDQGEFEKTPVVDDKPRNEGDESYWDNYEPVDWDDYYANEKNPLHPAYYRNTWRNPESRAIRNVLFSNISLMAKAEPSGDFLLVASDFRTSVPLSGVKVSLQTFQRQVIASGLTDKEGMVNFKGIERPAFVTAERMGQYAYLRIDEKTALVTSHFDVGGDKSVSGLKGFIYGDRGIWRPGDPIHLTFILSDPRKTIPANHPVKLELRDPRGTVTVRKTLTESVDGMYYFPVSTDYEAPTGDWTARVKVGDRVFTKSLKIETIMPNRIKILFDIPETAGGIRSGDLTGKIVANWLHGAPASDLRSDIRVRFRPVATTFPGYAEYAFDDPTRTFSGREQTLFDGHLDGSGKADIAETISADGVSPGKLQADFSVRVFEQSDISSIEFFSRVFSPYERYVGIRTPKGDEARGMLLTDTDHVLKVALLDASGKPVPSGTVHARLMKIQWRWWWEKGDEDLSSYAESKAYRLISEADVPIRNGVGEWTFRVNYPDWGRYFIRVNDDSGEHSTGKIVYIDWPGWAGRAREGSGSASMLSLTTDKPKYAVGEKITFSMPSNVQGRAFVVLEAGGKILKREWIQCAEGTTRYTFTATEDMTPNIYAHVSFIQPHLQTANDLPIRLYGIIPVTIENPSTHIEPVLETPVSYKPDGTAEIVVREARGREMTYTIAIVDEGLLRINRYVTPDPWGSFYSREASALKGWDLYDYVAGAYSGKLQTLLAVGGGDEGDVAGERKANRFKPVVHYIAPERLAAGGRNVHTFKMPRYVGAVRVMLVAARNGSYGAVEKEVPVKADLMLLGTLPRVLGTGEEVEAAVTVFNYRPDLKSVAVRCSVEGALSVSGSAVQNLSFQKEGDQLARFRLKVGDAPGIAKIRFRAESGNVSVSEETEIDIRLPSSPETNVVSSKIASKRTWQDTLDLPGLPGTNEILLELSRIPPLDLGRNLEYLIRYPHGCIEQTTSSVFPQVYLDRLLNLNPQKATNVQRNIAAGLERLRFFQTSSGGFSYWPGDGKENDWGTTYAGHFLLEAKARGFSLPAEMLSRWTSYQQTASNRWNGTGDEEELQQAYRLYTLALAGFPNLGAMNRLRDRASLSIVAKWRLANAYALSGQREEAKRMVFRLGSSIPRYRALSGSFGSDLRDRAMILETMVALSLTDDAEELAADISSDLEKDTHGTQTTAYSLLALARYAFAGPQDGSPVRISYSWNEGVPVSVGFSEPIYQASINPGNLTRGKISIANESDVTVYPRLILRGIPELGREKNASNGLTLSVAYRDGSGYETDPARALPGTDLIIAVTVVNTSKNRDYEHLALNLLLPGSWEAVNNRVSSEPDARATSDESFDYQDIRDDRIYTYFSLARGRTKGFEFPVTVSYSGRFYLPPVSIEAMYDPGINARTAGKWLAR